MAIRVRRGNEADFDVNKMLPGEWAVSLDTRYVRMCFAPGVCLRMATYESFESDMERIEEIFQEVTTIEEAIKKIYKEFGKAELDIEVAKEAAATATEKAEAASTSANNAATSATKAAEYSSNAARSEANALLSAESAELAMNAAKTSEENASASASTSVQKAEEAAASATSASESENNAYDYMQESKSYAVGGTGTRENEDLDNAKYYMEQAKTLANIKGGLLPMGTIAFAQLASVNPEAGYMYNISDEFVSDERFKDGSGRVYPVGTNVYYTVDGYWDCLAGFQVTGVKGSAESDYRKGNVEITPANLGLGNVLNDIDNIKESIEVLSNDIVESSDTDLIGSRDGGLRFNEMLGKSEQNGTPTPSAPVGIKGVKGKNLLDCSSLTAQTINGGTFTPVYDNKGKLLYVEVNGKFTANTEYKVADLTTFDGTLGNNFIFNGCPSGGSTSTYCMFYLEWDSNWGALNRIADTGSGANIQSNVNTAYMNVRIYIQNGYTANNLRFYPMVRTGGNSSYVPYGLIGLNTHGKNLAKTCIYGTNIASDYGGLVRQVEANNIKAGKTYTMSVELTASSNTSAYWNTGSGLIASPINFNITAGTKRYFHTFVATKDYVNVVNSWLSKQGTGDNVAITASNFQIEEGTETEYEPYQESVAYLSDIDLNSIGDLKDRLIRKDGLWQIERNVGVYTITSSIGVTIYDDVDGISRFRVNATPKNATNEVNLLSKHFSSGYTLTEINKSALPNKVCIYTNELWFTTNRGAYTAGDFKTFIVGKNILYTLDAPTYEVLPTADQIALNSLLTFDGTTYLSIESELEPQFTLEYGTSKVGGYILKSLNTAEANTARISAIESTTNNLATAVLQGE